MSDSNSLDMARKLVDMAQEAEDRGDEKIAAKRYIEAEHAYAAAGLDQDWLFNGDSMDAPDVDRMSIFNISGVEALEVSYRPSEGTPDGLVVRSDALKIPRE